MNTHRLALSAAALGLLQAACGGTAPATPPATGAAASTAGAPTSGAREAGPVLPAALAIPTDGPSLFLGAGPGAPAVGYVAADVPVQPAGPVQNGRALVRIDGPLRVRAHMPVELMGSRVQRRGTLRNTPIYLGPNDLVQVQGPPDADGRVTIIARAPFGDGRSDAYTGTFPAIGIANRPAPDEAEAPSPGQDYKLAAGTSMTLHDAPAGSITARIAATDEDIRIALIRSDSGWNAVRVGDGPYLIGYTQSPIVAGTVPAPHVHGATPSDGPIPSRIAREAGQLHRVAAGTKVTFNSEIIAVFKQQGWARVLTHYNGGLVDVFAGINDDIAVRGLVEQSALLPAD